MWSQEIILTFLDLKIFLHKMRIVLSVLLGKLKEVIDVKTLIE